MDKLPQIDPKASGLVAALVIIYHLLIGFGVKLPSLPAGFETSLGLALTYILGVLTPHPAQPKPEVPTSSIQDAEKKP